MNATDAMKWAQVKANLTGKSVYFSMVNGNIKLTYKKPAKIESVEIKPQ